MYRKNSIKSEINIVWIFLCVLIIRLSVIRQRGPKKFQKKRHPHSAVKVSGILTPQSMLQHHNGSFIKQNRDEACKQARAATLQPYFFAHLWKHVRRGVKNRDVLSCGSLSSMSLDGKSSTRAASSTLRSYLPTPYNGNAYLVNVRRRKITSIHWFRKTARSRRKSSPPTSVNILQICILEDLFWCGTHCVHKRLDFHWK